MKYHILFGGQDIGFHVKRMLELKESLKHGYFLMIYSFNQFHGSPVMALYPYITLLPFVCFSFFIKSKITLIFVSYIICEFIGLLISFFSSYSFCNSRKTSYLFAIMYNMSTMFLYAAFAARDIGTTLAFIFFPLVIFGSLILFKENKWVELSLGLTFLIYSHVLSAIIAIGYLILLILFNITKLDKQNIFDFVKSLILTILLTSIVWLPSLNFIIGLIKNDISSPAHIAGTGYPFINLITNIFGNRLDPFVLGIIPLMTIVIALICYKRLSFEDKILLLISIIVVLFCSKLFPWQFTDRGILKIFGIIQYPGRIYIIPETLMLYLLAKIISNIHYPINDMIIIVMIIVAIFLQCTGQETLIYKDGKAPVINKEYVNKYIKPIKYQKYPIRNNYRIIKSNEFKYIIAPSTTFMIDYYPTKSISKVKYINNNKATYGHNRTINVKHMGYNQFSFNSPKKINRLVLPLLHYNNEHLRVYVNHHLVHYHVNRNSLITLRDIKGGENQIKVQSISNVLVISIEVFLFLIGLFWLSIV